MTLFCDMDGVLADFDAHYAAVFGVQASKAIDNVDWSKVRAVNGFYAAIPPMPDMPTLWQYIKRHNPVILTGVPYSVDEAPANKIGWVRKHLGPHIEVRCTKSKDKCQHASPGDVLIDDWEKYKSLWIGKGGIWITHTNAVDTIQQLAAIGL